MGARKAGREGVGEGGGGYGGAGLCASRCVIVCVRQSVCVCVCECVCVCQGVSVCVWRESSGEVDALEMQRGFIDWQTTEWQKGSKLTDWDNGPGCLEG